MMGILLVKDAEQSSFKLSEAPYLIKPLLLEFPVVKPGKSKSRMLFCWLGLLILTSYLMFLKLKLTAVFS